MSVTDAGSWFAYPGSAATNRMDLTIDQSKTNVYFRMVYPQTNNSEPSAMKAP